MKSFRELYCEAEHCRDDEYVPRVFWHCLYRQTLPVAGAILFANPDYFSADRDLITFAGRATTLRQFNDEVRDFVKDHRNRSFARGGLRLRVSVHRLRGLVVRHLGAPVAGEARAAGATSVSG